MKAVTDAFGVSRSQQSYRRCHGCDRKPRYSSRPEDGQYLPMMRQIIDERPTYGYRRVTAILNLRRRSHGMSAVNVKRVYRIMRVNGLLLGKSTGKPVRQHTGVIKMAESNRRWCSDVFEIPCDNGQRLRVAFSMDCCDREILSYVACTGGITADMVSDMLLDSVQSRFGDVHRVPEPIQWLSDNGPQYIAAGTQEVAKILGFEVCTTPYRSPESNGMAEAFVKTFKRDYIEVHGAPDAHSVIRLLSHMFNDYNENAPHKGLRMLSPRQFRRLQNRLETCPV